MRYAWSLRTRCVAAMTALVVSLCVTFAIALRGFIEILRGYIVRGAQDADNIPSALRSLADGIYGSMDVDDHRKYVAVDSLPDARLYVPEGRRKSPNLTAYADMTRV